MLVKEEVKNWWKQAEEDLDTAKYNLDGNKLKAGAFYAQQAVEKALKSLILKEKKYLVKAHDLVQLARLVNAPGNILSLCAMINPAYTATRYPDVEGTFQKKEVEDILNASEEVLAWVKHKL